MLPRRPDSYGVAFLLSELLSNCQFIEVIFAVERAICESEKKSLALNLPSPRSGTRRFVITGYCGVAL